MALALYMTLPSMLTVLSTHQSPITLRKHRESPKEMRLSSILRRLKTVTPMVGDRDATV